MNKYIYHKPLVNIINNDNLNNDTRNVPQLYLIFHDILFKFLKSKPVNYNNQKNSGYIIRLYLGLDYFGI